MRKGVKWEVSFQRIICLPVTMMQFPIRRPVSNVQKKLLMLLILFVYDVK
jgi:hypothetical protein